MRMRKSNCVPRLTVCVHNNCWLSRLLILISHFTHVQSFCPQVRAHLELLPAWLPPSPPIIVIWWPVSWFRCVRFLGWPGPPALVRNNNTRHGGRREEGPQPVEGLSSPRHDGTDERRVRSESHHNTQLPGTNADLPHRDKTSHQLVRTEYWNKIIGRESRHVSSSAVRFGRYIKWNVPGEIINKEINTNHF